MVRLIGLIKWGELAEYSKPDIDSESSSNQQSKCLEV